MKKVNKSQELVLVDTTVPQTLDILNQRISALKHIEETVYKTTGNFENGINITTETKISNLIKVYSTIKGKENAYNNAAKELGLSTYEAFSISGGTSEQWKHDIQLRIAIINHKETLDTLIGFKKEVESFMSAEDKKTLVFNRMSEFLGKM